MKYRRIFFLMVAGCFLFLTAFDHAEAQNINIDFGSHFATPSNTFGAASGQVGVWNTLGLGAASNLLDINGASTTVNATVNADDGEGWYPTCSGDISALLSDNFFTTQATWSVVLSGLANGGYSVYLYGPSHPGVETGNMVVNGVSVPSISGDGCSFLSGTTYTTVAVSVNNGTLTISGTNIASYAGLAGIQIVPPSVPGAGTGVNGQTPQGTCGMPGASFPCLF